METTTVGDASLVQTSRSAKSSNQQWPAVPLHKSINQEPEGRCPIRQASSSHDRGRSPRSRRVVHSAQLAGAVGIVDRWAEADNLASVGEEAHAARGLLERLCCTRQLAVQFVL